MKWGEKAPPPDLKLENGQLTNWREVESWAFQNNRLWYDAIQRSLRADFSHTDAVKIIAYHQLLEIERLEKKVQTLTAIAPKRMRDAKGMVWHCPDNLIPEEQV